MAQSITLTSGSIFAGNPITIAYTALDLSDRGTPSFHRVIFKVIANGIDFQFSQPVTTEGSVVEVDISSAFRAVFDAVERTPQSVTPPSATWTVKAHDEWMLDGITEHSEDVTLNGYTVYPGAFSDIERIMGRTNLPRFFSHKPSSSPEIVCAGDTLCRPGTGSVPSSSIISINDYADFRAYNVYVITPAHSDEQRHQFRFINAFGCLESISCPRAYQKQNDYTTSKHVIAKKQRFDAPSHAVVRKIVDHESWKFSSGPLDEKWLQWFIHDFLMVEDAWMQAPTLDGTSSGTWLRVHIIPEETITYIDETKTEHYEVLFTVQFDINGHVFI